MKKLIWLITVLLAGLGGYWLGQQPESPRIFDWMSARAEQFEDTRGSAWLSDRVNDGRQAGATGQTQAAAHPAMLVGDCRGDRLPATLRPRRPRGLSTHAAAEFLKTRILCAC